MIATLQLINACILSIKYTISYPAANHCIDIKPIASSKNHTLYNKAPVWH